MTKCNFNEGACDEASPDIYDRYLDVCKRLQETEEHLSTVLKGDLVPRGLCDDALAHIGARYADMEAMYNAEGVFSSELQVLLQERQADMGEIAATLGCDDDSAATILKSVAWRVEQLNDAYAALEGYTEGTPGEAIRRMQSEIAKYMPVVQAAKAVINVQKRGEEPGLYDLRLAVDAL
jgi:hypothetical protein